MADWFEEWFGEEYLHLYPHRDEADADHVVGLIAGTVPAEPGWRVLDIACGAGRHARAFRARGLATVGLDLSMALLRRARQATGAPLIRADMRSLPVRPASMDLTVNLFTSFGYFESDADHQQSLAEMLATVRPGGWFVIDFLNADWVRRTLVSQETAELGGTAVQVERRLHEGDRFVMKTITVPDGRRFRERVRLFAPGELAEMVERAGGRIRHRFGGYDGPPPGADQPRIILMAEVG